MQTNTMASESETSRKEIGPSTTGVPSSTPAIGIIFPAPVMAAIVTAAKLAKEPYSANQNEIINR
jgi:hypothetical protein